MNHHRVMREAIVLAGGWGERLWPLTRKANPKQLGISGGPAGSLLEETLGRLGLLFSDDEIVISTSEDLVGPIRSKTGDRYRLLSDPCKRNTTGAIIWSVANLLCRQGGEDTSICVVPSDHWIRPREAQSKVLEEAMSLAEAKDCLVLFGISPTRPEPGFGYLNIHDGQGRIAGFIEKPDSAAAELLIEKGWHWNSGMLAFKVGRFLSELDDHVPQVSSVVRRLVPLIQQRASAEEIAKVFAELPNSPIDRLLLEKSSRMNCIKTDFEWDDLGSLESVLRITEPSRVVQVQSNRAAAITTKPETCVVFCGVSDILTVVTEDAVLVCDRNNLDLMRQVVEKLEIEAPDWLKG